MTLDNIKDKAGSLDTYELMELLHQGNFNLSVFEQMIKSSGNCQNITQDVLDGRKKNYSHTTAFQVRTQSTN